MNDPRDQSASAKSLQNTWTRCRFLRPSRRKPLQNLLKLRCVPSSRKFIAICRRLRFGVTTAFGPVQLLRRAAVSRCGSTRTNKLPRQPPASYRYNYSWSRGEPSRRAYYCACAWSEHDARERRLPRCLVYLRWANRSEIQIQRIALSKTARRRRLFGTTIIALESRA